MFSALSDPTRGDILSRLRAGDATDGQLAAPYDVNQPAVSRHLRVPWVLFMRYSFDLADALRMTRTIALLGYTRGGPSSHRRHRFGDSG